MPNLSNANLFSLFLLLIIIAFLQRFFYTSYKARKHKKNVSTGERVITKLNTFNGPYKNQKVLTYLRKIDAYVFEELVLSSLEQRGCLIIRNKSYSRDGGLDGQFMLNGSLYLVQSKRYTGQVKTSHILEFVNLIKERRCVGGYFIHTGSTAGKSLSNYKNSKVKIISGDSLVSLILEPVLV